MKGAYYNENNRGAAAWLRELIKRNLIAPGEVDERSIKDVAPQDVKGFAQVHLFAGIGGWSLALRLAGWPDERPIWTGSCPCQSFSQAGNRKGKKDPRHLWPEFFRFVAHCRPPIITGEQVASKLGRQWLAGVRSDLEKLEYAFGAADLCAAGAGAPHIRQRLFWLAFAQSGGFSIMRGEGGKRRSRHINSSGQIDRMANTKSHRKGRGELRIEGEEGLGRDRSSINGFTGGLADSERYGGRKYEQEREAEERVVDWGTHKGTVGLVDSNWARCREFGRPVTMASQKLGVKRPGSCFWSSFSTIACADGKTRRFEPGSFPLADGIPGRVGLLRGYGNAIVPEIAAVFIRALQEISEPKD